jgi:hypothetical protein
MPKSVQEYWKCGFGRKRHDFNWDLLAQSQAMLLFWVRTFTD